MAHHRLSALIHLEIIINFVEFCWLSALPDFINVLRSKLILTFAMLNKLKINSGKNCGVEETFDECL